MLALRSPSAAASAPEGGKAGRPAALSKFELFLAGSLAGVAQITLTYPAEVVFTRLAMSGAAISTVKYTGIVDCFVRTVRTEGVRALYNGYVPTLISGVPYVALQMSCYEIFQRALAGEGAGGNPSTAAKLAAGAGAGLVAQTLTFPGDVVRKRMQSDGMGGQPKAYTGLVDAVRKIHAKEGIAGFFGGVRVNSWRCLPEGAIMFYTFDSLKRLLGIAQFDTK